MVEVIAAARRGHHADKPHHCRSARSVVRGPQSLRPVPRLRWTRRLSPPPRVRQSALTASGRDSLIGQMMPQPEVGPARRALLDAHLTCHQWLALGVGVDPVSHCRRTICKSSTLSGLASCASTEAQRMREPFIPAPTQSLRGLGQAPPGARRLVRPDRFIAARLDPNADLSVLAPFSVAPALRKPALRRA